MVEVTYNVDRRGATKGVAFHLTLAIVCLLFHLFASPLARDHPDLPDAWETLASYIGIAGFVLFAVLGLRFLRMLVSSEPYLVINTEGILDNASGMFSGAGWIKWEEVADIRLSKYHNLPCVELVLKDRERFLQRFGWAERLNRSYRLGYPTVALRGPLLPVEPAVLVEQIQGYWQRAPDTYPASN